MLARYHRLTPFHSLRGLKWSSVTVESRQIALFSSFHKLSACSTFSSTKRDSCADFKPFKYQYRSVINISYGDFQNDTLSLSKNSRSVKIRYFALSTLAKVCAPEVFTPILKVLDDLSTKSEEESLFNTPAGIKQGLTKLLERHTHHQHAQETATIGLEEFVDLCSLSAMCIENDLKQWKSNKELTQDSYDSLFHADFVQRLNDISERAAIVHNAATSAISQNRFLITDALTVTDETALTTKMQKIQQNIDGHCSWAYNETVALMNELSELMDRFDAKHDLTTERLEASIQKLSFEKPIQGNVEDEDHFQEFCQEELQRWQDNHPESVSK